MVSISYARKKTSGREPRSLDPWQTFFVFLLTILLAGCAGERPKPKVAPEEAAPSPQRLREAIGYYSGTAYKYGGDSKDGLDCSGFVMKAYEMAGMHLPRTSEQQFQGGKRVSRNNLKYGDLVFFNRYCQSKYSYATASILAGLFAWDEQPCHVGIYIGNDRFIHASATRGGIMVSTLNQDAWKRSLIGARRYLPE